MQKRGASHIDWAISMGIFILAILAIFIYLKPVFKPSITSGNLLPIIEEGFKDGGYWTVKKLPILLKSCNVPYSVDVQFLNGWKDQNDSSGVFLNREGSYVFNLHNLENKNMDVDYSVIPNTCGNSVSFGVTEDFHGISLEKLNNVKSKGYEFVKIDWKYPSQNEFAIYLDSNLIIGKEEGNRNVFVKQYKEFIVDKNGNLKDVTVSLRAW